MRTLRDITVFCFLCICTLSFTLHCSPSVSPTESTSEVFSDASTAQTEKAQQAHNETAPEIVGEWKAPLSPRDIPFYNDPAIRSASLADMKWKLIKEGTLKSGVKVMAGTLQAWSFTTYKKDGTKVRIPWEQVLFVFLPPGYPNRTHPGFGKGLLYNFHNIYYNSNGIIDIMTPVPGAPGSRGEWAEQIAVDYGIPVVFHGWSDESMKVTGSSGFHTHQFYIILEQLLKQYPCDPKKIPFDGSLLINGHPLVKGDMYAITALQRLAEKAGGKVDKVGSVGISKEGWSHWLLASVDERLEVASPGGHLFEDFHTAGQAYEKEWGCASPPDLSGDTASHIINLMRGLPYWLKNTPAGQMVDRVTNVSQFQDKLYPRHMIISGDMTLPNQHDRFYPLTAENAFLAQFNHPNWQYWRVKGASGVSRLIESDRGRALLPAVAESLVYKTSFPKVKVTQETDAQRRFSVTVQVDGAVDEVRLHVAASANTFWNDKEHQPGGAQAWKEAKLSKQADGSWKLPEGGWSQSVPAGHQVAMYVEALRKYTRGKHEYILSSSSPFQVLFPLAAKTCAPYQPPKQCQ